MKTVLAGLLATALLIPSLASAATYTVNRLDDAPDANVGDNVCAIATGSPNKCTLRAAIEEANSDPLSFDRIEFGLGLIAIDIDTTPLPTLTGHTVIDGRTAPGYNTGTIDVADAPPSVYIEAGTGLPATADGFRIFPSNRNYAIEIHAIGIIGFPDNGIEVQNDDVPIVEGNWIGVGRSGAIAGNGGAGVYLKSCNRSRIGKRVNPSGSFDIEGIGNVISNNGEDGVYVLLGEDNIIGGNLIGEDPVGSFDFGNGGHGINLQGANDLIGEFYGLSAGDFRKTPNIITNNAGDGIYTVTGGHRIYTNTIYGNDGNGVSLNGANSRLGYVSAEMRNLIQGNGGHGVEIGKSLLSLGNTVQYNWIYQNTLDGVHITNGSGNAVRQNDVFDNSGNAVQVLAAGNTISSNGIGFLDTSVVGNAFNGIVLGAGGNTVSGNRIAAMDDDGIDVVSGDGNTISGNQIGSSNAGVDWGNTSAGVRVRAAASNTRIEDNRIGHNNNGVELEGGGTDVCGNRIGVGSSDELAGNSSEGIWAKGGGNRIGDVSVGCSGNVIGDNGSDGIEIWGGANVVRDNQIGGVTAINLGNHNGGILLTTAAASFNEIVGNALWNNSNDGVRIGSTSGTRNRIENNSFGNNGDIGIDLLDNGITPNDAGDVDTGPNNLQNTPVITALTGGAGELLVSYRIDSGSTASVYPLNADFYLSGPGTNQGFLFLQRDVYNVTPNSTKNITVALPSGVSTGGLTVMTIDADGNSSEFTAPMAFTAIPVTDDIFRDGFED